MDGQSACDVCAVHKIETHTFGAVHAIASHIHVPDRELEGNAWKVGDCKLDSLTVVMYQ